MPEVRLLPLIERFTTMLAELPVLTEYFRGHLKIRGVVSPGPYRRKLLGGAALASAERDNALLCLAM
jgi:hypothetical protein